MAHERLSHPATQIARCRDAIVKATEAIIADAAMVHDSDRWFRHTWAQVQKFRDAPTLDAAATLAQIVGEASGQPTFAFRLGYASRTAPTSPRRPVEQLIVG